MNERKGKGMDRTSCARKQFQNLPVDSRAFLYTYTRFDLATKIIIIMSISSYYDYHNAEINYDI